MQTAPSKTKTIFVGKVRSKTRIFESFQKKLRPLKIAIFEQINFLVDDKYFPVISCNLYTHLIEKLLSFQERKKF